MTDGLADREVHKSRPPVHGPSIYDFRQPRQDWAMSRLAVTSWPVGARVLDAGCGTGAYVPATRELIGATGTIVGLDIGIERAAVTPSDVPIVGDVQALPCRDEIFDVVLAMHMLYHVPDISLAVSEFRRVLRPGGQLVVSTNSVADERELLDLIVDAGVVDHTAFGDTRFCSENAAEMLAPAFDRIDVHLEASTLVVPDPAAVVTSVESMKYVLETKLRPGVEWPDFVSAVAAGAGAVIESRGTFDITCQSSVLVCS